MDVGSHRVVAGTGSVLGGRIRGDRHAGDLLVDPRHQNALQRSAERVPNYAPAVGANRRLRSAGRHHGSCTAERDARGDERRARAGVR